MRMIIKRFSFFIYFVLFTVNAKSNLNKDFYKKETDSLWNLFLIRVFSLLLGRYLIRTIIRIIIKDL